MLINMEKYEIDNILMKGFKRKIQKVLWALGQ